jgi:hypothetical protein
MLAWARARGSFLMLLSIVVGSRIGATFGSDVCSEPTCRALAAGMEKCPRCQGAIASRVSRGFKHFSAAADVRRELHALGHRPVEPGRKWKSALGAARSSKAGRRKP